MSGCGEQRSGGVPKIEIGKDACSRCGMIISEARYASGYINSEGESVLFDDLGEFLEALRHDHRLMGRAYVNDLEKMEWTKADQATYVRVPSLATPMGSGIAAFDSRARAEIFAKARAEKTTDLQGALQSFQER